MDRRDYEDPGTWERTSRLGGEGTSYFLRDWSLGQSFGGFRSEGTRLMLELATFVTSPGSPNVTSTLLAICAANDFLISNLCFSEMDI